VGKKGNSFYYLQGEKLATEIKDSIDIPLYSNSNYQWGFDVKKKKVNLYSTKILNRFYTVYAGNGVYFTPSYAFEMGCFPEVRYFIGEIGVANSIYAKSPSSKKSKGAINMVDDLVGSIKKEQKVNEKITAFLVSFYEQGVNGRGYQTENTSIVIQNTKGNVVASKLLLTNNYYWDIGCVVSVGVRFFSNSLVEVKDYKFGNYYYDEIGDSMKINSKYAVATFYKYYRIDPSGNVFRCENNRVHEFTKYVLIDSTYFDVCDLLENSKMIRMDTEDLDFMIQEIYADYGLIFTDKKWADYFAAQSWYKPQYNNVDSLLSNIDKQNLLFIKKKKLKMDLQELKQLEKETGLKSPR
jgi:hypothetical protein